MPKKNLRGFCAVSMIFDSDISDTLYSFESPFAKHNL